MTTLDDLELELRKLPGVRSAGFAERDDLLFVQLHLGEGYADATVPMQAARIAYRNSDRPVAVELVRWRTVEAPQPVDHEPAEITNDTAPTLPAVDFGATAESEAARDVEIDLREPLPSDTRARLLAVLTFPDTDELEVHLIHAGRRAIGRADAANGLVAAVEATIDAVSQLATGLALDATWARTLESQDHGFLVAVGVTASNQMRHGIASGATPVEAAARGTLAAINRTIAPNLEAFAR